MSTGAIRHSSPRFDNVFFPSVAVLILASVFLGFARTYYLAGVFRAPLPNLLVHIHGAVFSLWILLLIAQTSFIARGRVDVHRRMGLFGFGLACLMVILGLMTATDSLGRHFAPGQAGVGVKAFYAVPTGDMLVFSTLIYFGSGSASILLRTSDSCLWPRSRSLGRLSCAGPSPWRGGTSE